MIYEEAHKIAVRVVEEMLPYCERIEIGGSLRRKKAEVKDIEIIVISNDREGLKKVVDKWMRVKGEVTGKYTQRILPDGIKLDLFFATKENFGNIFLIRTGNWQFSRQMMIKLLQKGLKQKDGYLWKGEEKINCYEEEDIFRLLDTPYIEPEKREM